LFGSREKCIEAQSNIKTILLLFALFAIGLFEQTTNISSGSYGPFSIGDSKAATLEKVERITAIVAVEPVPPDDIYLVRPTLKSIHALDKSNGILVWLDEMPFPLRIEMSGNAVTNKWGTVQKCLPSQTRLGMACSEINRLSPEIAIGFSRDDVYKTIIAFDTKLSKQVGPFVVGLQEFRTGKNKSEPEFRKLILANDAWQFDGLKQLSRYKNPFYSRVTLYFSGDRLSKIRHWSAPYEMP